MGNLPSSDIGNAQIHLTKALQIISKMKFSYRGHFEGLQISCFNTLVHSINSCQNNKVKDLQKALASCIYHIPRIKHDTIQNIAADKSVYHIQKAMRHIDSYIRNTQKTQKTQKEKKKTKHVNHELTKENADLRRRIEQLEKSSGSKLRSRIEQLEKSSGILNQPPCNPAFMNNPPSAPQIK